MISKILRTLIMGPPGSGKGTIANRIVKDFGFVHVSSGDLLRHQIKAGTELGLQAKKHIEEGHLVPDDLIVDLVVEELDKLNRNWLLDGFPRTLSQAQALLKREELDAVMNLDVPFEVIMHRIEGRWTHLPSGRIYHTEFNPPVVPGVDDLTGEPLVQRDDDKHETVQRRLEGYQKMTQPVLDFFRKEGLLTEFKGSYSNEIWPHVHKFVSTLKEPIQYTHYE